MLSRKISRANGGQQNPQCRRRAEKEDRGRRKSRRKKGRTTGGNPSARRRKHGHLPGIAHHGSNAKRFLSVAAGKHVLPGRQDRGCVVARGKPGAKGMPKVYQITQTPPIHCPVCFQAAGGCNGFRPASCLCSDRICHAGTLSRSSPARRTQIFYAAVNCGGLLLPLPAHRKGYYDGTVGHSPGFRSPARAAWHRFFTRP